MNKILRLLFILGFSLFFPVSTYAVDFSTERNAAWETYKQLYIEGYKDYPVYGLVVDAGSCNYSNDACDYAVSEGQGYGMLLAVIHNDQATFDKIFAATEKFMWNGQSYDWKVGVDGNKQGWNAATDGDEDVAMALILADKKQQRGEWQKNDDYGKKAQVLINNIFDLMTGEGGYLWPGDYNGHEQELNLSYFSPAWYRVFDDYEKTDHNWQQVIDKQYEILDYVGNRYNGLIPDWCDEYGDVTDTGQPHNMAYDAIRVPWRIAIDSKWNKEERAQQYLDQVLGTVLSKGGVSNVRMYSIPDGSPIEWHNELSVVMWAAGAHGSSLADETKQEFYKEVRSDYNATDKSFNKDWADSKWLYFNQSLVLLSTAFMDGSFDRELYYAQNNSGNNDQDQTSDKSNKKKIFRKKGTFMDQQVTVKVIKQGKRYKVRIYNRTYGKGVLFFKKSYRMEQPLKKIQFSKNKLILQHKQKKQKVFTFEWKLIGK